MKRLTFALLICMIFIFTSCLGYRGIMYRIFFNENFKSGSIVMTFEDIQSDNDIRLEDATQLDSAKTAKINRERASDFKSLLKMCQDDQELIDAMDQGIYLKKRYLYENNGKLFGRWEGIFSELKFDEGDSLKILKDEIYLTMEMESGAERIETDGQLVQEGKRFTITWPKSKRDIYWRLIMKEEDDATSLIDEYRAWRDKL